MKCDCRLRKEYYKGNIFRSSEIEEQRRRRGTFPASIKRGDAKPVTMCGFSPLEPRCGDRGEGLRVTRIQFSHGEQRRTLVPKSFFSEPPLSFSPSSEFFAARESSSLRHPLSPASCLPHGVRVCGTPMWDRKSWRTVGSKWELVCLCNGQPFRGALAAHILR